MFAKNGLFFLILINGIMSIVWKGGKLTEEEMNNNFNSQIKRDKLKKELCIQNNIELIYINYNDKNIEDMIKEIIIKYNWKL
jgi:hypothetical protein